VALARTRAAEGGEEDMRRTLSKRWVWFAAAGLAVSLVVRTAHAGEPFVGINAGAAVPTEKFAKSADPGGMIAPFAGYRLFTLADTIALSAQVQPQFALFQTSIPTRQSDVSSFFSITGGPRISLLDEHLEAFFTAQGGYYISMSGPTNGNDGGWNIAGGLNYEFLRGTFAGIFLQRDSSYIRGARGSTDNLTFISAGLSAQHYFLPPPPVVAEAPPPPPPPPPPAKKKIVLRGVNFDFNKSDIRADAQPILDEAISTLKEYTDITLSVDGYTDGIGTEAYNQKLSVRRAQAVADYLAKGGIAAARMAVKGFGKSNPVASNDTAEGRAENRRVELKITQQPE
jgi:outer membrane protein OmpA-like peptidoglycan-associated protein